MFRKWSLSRTYAVLIAFGFLLAVFAMVLHGSPLCEGDNEPFTIQTVKQTAAYGLAQYDEQDQSTTPWLCNFSIGDLAFVFFTYCLVIVGWAMLKSAAANVRTVEQANVFFMLSDNPSVHGNTFDGAIQASNTGRSPAFLVEYFVGFSRTEPAGAKPAYEHKGTFYSEPLNLVVSAGKAVDLKTVQVDVAAEPYVFGFFRYKDIFRRTRTSRFCLKFDLTTGRLFIAGQPVWNAWD